jgi:3-oxoacyl-[acyl-carrier protein] reductase
MASTNGVYGQIANVNYSAAKGGVMGLTKALAREWAPLKINVNAAAPGYVTTRLTSAREEGDTLGIPAEVVDQIVSKIPIGRAGRPEDVAGLVAWLVSPDSDYVTGQIVEIHGGLEIISVV